MDPTSNLPPVIASRYVPVRLIAKGGMGAVYEVEHARTGERLALKVLLSGVGASAGALERFKREARASARIKSEHVVRVTDADVAPELDGAPFLVMELLEGQDLERVAASASAPVEPAKVVEWLRQVARALNKAHQLGIVHRDLKPENLFLATPEDGPAIVKILDFGIVKMAEEGTKTSGSGQILGTPKYMAPEQASLSAPVTPATDRYALGLVAYRLLVGESYYQGGAMSVLGQLLHGELQLPSQRGCRLGSAFDAWFLKACHKDPQERFASASEQIEGLADALGLPLATKAVARVASSEATPAPNRRVVTIALLVAGGLAAALAAGTVRNQSRATSGVTVAPKASAPFIAAAFPAPPVHAPPPPSATPRTSAPEAKLADSGSVSGPSGRGLTKPRRRETDAARATVSQPKEEPPQALDPYADQK